MESAGEDVVAAADEALGAPAPGESVLVLAPAMDRRVDGCCVDVSRPGPPTDVSLLCVALNGSEDGVVDRWTAHAGSPPGRTAVVTTGGPTRGAAASPGGRTATPVAGDLRTTSVSDPGDLTGLGIKISQCLSSWEGREAEIALCFDSLTTLLQFADLQRVFRFVHLLTNRVASADARGHFHMDPNAHDDQAVATIRSLFDRVLELDADGTWRVR